MTPVRRVVKLTAAGSTCKKSVELMVWLYPDEGYRCFIENMLRRSISRLQVLKKRIFMFALIKLKRQRAGCIS